MSAILFQTQYVDIWWVNSSQSSHLGIMEVIPNFVFTTVANVQMLDHLLSQWDPLFILTNQRL